jgi:hypothetical protein
LAFEPARHLKCRRLAQVPIWADIKNEVVETKEPPLLAALNYIRETL